MQCLPGNLTEKLLLLIVITLKADYFWHYHQQISICWRHAFSLTRVTPLSTNWQLIMYGTLPCHHFLCGISCVQMVMEFLALPLIAFVCKVNNANYYYYNRFTALCPGLPGQVGSRRINHSGFCWNIYIYSNRQHNILIVCTRCSLTKTSITEYLQYISPSSGP